MAPAAILRSLITLTALLLAAAPAYADTQLTPHKAEYKIKISVFGGLLNTELASTAQGYVATHRVKATGMAHLIARGEINDSSTFDRVASGIRPERFESNDTLTRDKTRASIHFDWATGIASGTVNEKISSPALIVCSD